MVGWGHYYTNVFLLFKDCLRIAGGVRGVDSEEDIGDGYFLVCWRSCCETRMRMTRGRGEENDKSRRFMLRQIV